MRRLFWCPFVGHDYEWLYYRIRGRKEVAQWPHMRSNTFAAKKVCQRCGKEDKHAF